MVFLIIGFIIFIALIIILIKIANKRGRKKAYSKMTDGQELDYDCNRHANREKYFPKELAERFDLYAEKHQLSNAESKKIQETIKKRVKIAGEICLIIMLAFFAVFMLLSGLDIIETKREYHRDFEFLVSAAFGAGTGFAVYSLIKKLSLSAKMREMLELGRYRGYLVGVPQKLWSLQENQGQKGHFFEHYYIYTLGLLLKIDKKIYEKITDKAVILIFDFEQGKTLEIFEPLQGL